MTHRLDLRYRFRQTIKGSRLDLEDHIVVKNTTVPTSSVDRGVRGRSFRTTLLPHAKPFVYAPWRDGAFLSLSFHFGSRASRRR